MKRFDAFIPCSPKDYKKLPYVIQSLKNYCIGLNDIHVSVPDKMAFKDEIEGEHKVFYHNDFDILPTVDLRRCRFRPNWIFQQLLKLLQDVTGTETVLIFDAACILVREFNIFDGDKEKLYSKVNTEDESAYYRFINKLTNGDILRDSTSEYETTKYVADMQVFNKKIIDEMILKYCNSKQQFIDIVLDTTYWKNFNRVTSIFISEYELYGRYVEKYHMDKVSIVELKQKQYHRNQYSQNQTVYDDNDILNCIKEGKEGGFEIVKLHSGCGNSDIKYNKAKTNTINIIYRMCDSVNVCSVRNRCFNVSKNTLIKKCLMSLKQNIDNLNDDIDYKIYCVADNCSEDILQFIASNFKNLKVEMLQNHGNANSFCRCVQIASQIPDGQICYFLEDDYLFLKNNVLNNIVINLNTLSRYNNTQCAMMPDDYPDRYVNNKINTECCITDTGHFLKINKTTCTFVTYSQVIKKNYDNLMMFSKWPMVGEDMSVNKCWENTPLYQPIPAYTCHSQVKETIPIYISFQKIKNYFED